jgi:hypothetical protein
MLQLRTFMWRGDPRFHAYYRAPAPVGGWLPERWYTGYVAGESLCGLTVPWRSTAVDGSHLVDTATFERFYAARMCPACATVVRGLLE